MTFAVHDVKNNPLRNFILFILLIFAGHVCFSQYWQQELNYRIDVSLNDNEKSLDAFEKLIYVNHSPDTLTFIWFHVWPNAYKNDLTAFSDQLLENGNTKFYFSAREQKGYINRLDFKVDDVQARTEDHPQYSDIIKLILPGPLLPGRQISISTPFHVKLPFNFSRGGFDGNAFQITQWYPKPAVYDRYGWHEMPYLDQGEFFSDFGNYQINITVPADYIVAAPGLLSLSIQDSIQKKTQDNTPELNQLAIKQRSKFNHLKKYLPVSKSLVPGIRTQQVFKTLSFVENNVHDFAWFANKEFLTDSDTCALSSGHIIKVRSYYTPAQKLLWKNSIHFAKDAIRFYSENIGEYPYGNVTIVQGPTSFGGGMEYPAITVISPVSSEKTLDRVIAHELGHNWFYAVLATNEREFPWMDEGFNTFYEDRYMEQKYGIQTQENEILFRTKALKGTDQPIMTPAQFFSVLNYELVAYHKTAEWMKLLKKKLGSDVFKTMMHTYFKEWGFRHPYPEDFKKLVLAYDMKTDTIFSLLNKKGILPDNQYHGFSLVSPFKKNSIKSYLINPSKDLLLVSPALGANLYDKLMIGGLFTNYKIPPSHIQYLAIPLYGTGSKNISWLGKFSYSINPENQFPNTDIFINTTGFSIDRFKDSIGKNYILHMNKFVPGFKMIFKNSDPRSSFYSYIQWKTFLINEQSFSFRQDSIFTPSDTSIMLNVSITGNSRYLNQFQFLIGNSRVLYPYYVTFQVEQARDFIKPVITANYFFNYSKGGGLQVRLFAGKFIYSGGKTIRKESDNDRYFLNMTGPNGYEDYTYSDYFIGRNSFEGITSQQIMIRDGAFKVRTDLLANKIGKTDDWLSALNFNSSIPDNLNPLSLLPVKIPLSLFLDVGTYAGAWKINSTEERFLYDMGIHIPLLNESLNIYIPLIYNKVYRDYFKSTLSPNKFLKTISFDIRLYNKMFQKINQELQY